MDANANEQQPEDQPTQRRRKELEDELRTLAGDLHAATYRFLTALAEFDQLGGWVGEGVRSCAHWLGWQCGIGINAAREKVRVARSLEQLPAVAEKLRVGELSYSKARAITRIATPDTEEFLVKCALSGTSGQLERLVRYARKHGPTAAEEQAARIHTDRYVKHWTDSDGALIIKGRLPPELGAVVIRALEAAVDAAKKQALDAAREAREAKEETREEGELGPDEFNPSLRANRADALVDIAESFLAKGYREGNAGERYQVVVHVDATPATAAPPAGTKPRAAPYIEDIGPVVDSTALQVACDASVVVMTERDGETIDVGRRSRTIPPAIRRALKHRDGGCVFPGCTCRRFVDAHHIVHWAEGGRTALDNLVLLCRRHHRLAHTEGYTFQLKRGRVVVKRADGVVLPRHVPHRVPREGPGAVRRGNRERGVVVDRFTGTPRWDGGAPDYNLILSILGDFHRRRAANPPRGEPEPGLPGRQ